MVLGCFLEGCEEPPNLGTGGICGELQRKKGVEGKDQFSLVRRRCRNGRSQQERELEPSQVSGCLGAWPYIQV
jgi:hypothetical protein